MSILDELNKNKSNIDPLRVMDDLKKWLNDSKATNLMIESALMTLDAYFKEENK